MNTTDLAQYLMDEPDPAKRLARLQQTVPAIGLIEVLKAEVDRQKDANTAQALLAGERAVEAAAYVQDARARPVALWAYAVGLTVRGHFAEAIPIYEEARQGLQNLGHGEDATRAGMRQIQALAMLGDMNGALALAEEIREAFQGLGLLRDAALVSVNIGIIHYRSGRMSEAESTTEYALEQLSRVGDLVGQSKAHGNLALIYEAQDRYHEAIEHYQTTLDILRTHNLTEDFIGISVNLALLYRKKGRLNQALDLLSRVRAMYGKLDGSPNAAFAQLEEARIHLDLNLLSEARKLSQELVEVFAGRGMQMEQAEALTTLGSAQAKQGKLEEARQTLERARGGWLSLENAFQAALVDVSVASLFLESGRQGQVAALEQAVLVAGRAIEALGEAPSAKALGLSVMAEALLDLGNRSEAKHYLEEAASLAVGLGIPDLTIRIERLRGQMAWLEKRTHEAEQHFKQAIERLEGVRVSLPGDEFKSAYLGDKLEVYGDLVDLLLDTQHPCEAFEYAERAKSRALVDLLASRGESPRTAWSPEVERLQQELVVARHELNQHFLIAEAESAAGTRGSDWENMVAVEGRVTHLIRELERLQPEAAVTEPVQEFRLHDLRQALEPGAILLEYFHTRQGLMAFVVQGEDVQVVRELGTLEQVQLHLEQLEFFLNRVAQGGIMLKIYGEEALKRSVDDHLRALYRLLIEPLPLQLSGQHLIIVPHGILHAIPFAALFDGEQYLLDRAELSLSPSAAVFALCRKRIRHNQGSLVAFGVPIENIPQATQEVEQISRIAQSPHTFVGEAATLQNFFAAAPQAEVLHIASHGAFRPDNPMFSGLRMADGWLAARDLYNLHLEAELVVLSACETGLAKQASGDELMGLARGFLYAGAPCLIASLWPVRDDATAQFMTTLYTNLRAGMSVATAMRAAQLMLRRQYHNPYYWSAFTVTGDSHRTVRI
ncbi:CHAT domain-containing protein [uncultured Meiothermus sp.]|uniref:CHAT domain-containing protein n=1 Tax=uncultured Meiothermus sp. TaxID=157471 RepID=UPI00261B7A3F|nr:CHAT domain-containing protein [uncultured Meiothermus sp.]